MPMYVLERAFAEQLDPTSDRVKPIEEVIAAAERVGISADAVVEVNHISADMYA
jgi:hypothetical protein